MLTREGGEEPGPERLGKRHGGVTRHWTAKPPGLGRYRRLCLRPPIRLPSFRDGIRWASELKTPAKEVPSPTGEFDICRIGQFYWSQILNAGRVAPRLRDKARRIASKIAKLPDLLHVSGHATGSGLRVARQSAANWGAGQPALWR